MKAVLVVIMFWQAGAHSSGGGGMAFQTQLLPTMEVCKTVSASIYERRDLLSASDSGTSIVAYCVDIEDKGQ